MPTLLSREDVFVQCRATPFSPRNGEPCQGFPVEAQEQRVLVPPGIGDSAPCGICPLFISPWSLLMFLLVYLSPLNKIMHLSFPLKKPALPTPQQVRVPPPGPTPIFFWPFFLSILRRILEFDSKTHRAPHKSGLTPSCLIETE